MTWLFDERIWSHVTRGRSSKRNAARTRTVGSRVNASSRSGVVYGA